MNFFFLCVFFFLSFENSSQRDEPLVGCGHDEDPILTQRLSEWKEQVGDLPFEFVFFFKFNILKICLEKKKSDPYLRQNLIKKTDNKSRKNETETNHHTYTDMI